MIIDLILDREKGFHSIIKGGRIFREKEYHAKTFYNNVMQYHEAFPEIVEPIAEALDNGEEKDVKRELNKYIIEQEYNPEICIYINSVNWI